MGLADVEVVMDGHRPRRVIVTPTVRALYEEEQ